MRKYDAYIVGYYGMQNAGDDALLMASAWGAQQFLACDLIKSSNYGELDAKVFTHSQQNLRQKQAFKGQNRLLNWQHGLDSNRIIFGGGSVLHSASDINLKIQLMRLAKSSKHYAVGVGIEAFKSVNDEKACRKFLNACHFVGVRDKASFERASDLAPNGNIFQTFDLAPQLLCHPQFEANTTPRKGIAFNVCPSPKSAHGDVDEAEEGVRHLQLAKLATRIWYETQEPIAFFEMNGNAQTGDYRCMQKVMNLIPEDVPVEVIRYHSNPLKMMQMLGRFKAVVGMRLHAKIMAYLVNTPVISVNYHPKCHGWCEQIGVPLEYRVDANDIYATSLLAPILKGLKYGFARPWMGIEIAVNQSLNNWSKCYDFANNFSRHSLV